MWYPGTPFHTSQAEQGTTTARKPASATPKATAASFLRPFHHSHRHRTPPKAHTGKAMENFIMEAAPANTPAVPNINSRLRLSRIRKYRTSP